ncbi:MAG TPA: phosphoribosyltransferase family protein, partial [Flavobacteriaceae bacterium]|nr:phosphoribosyltransferase family protein [Flavobacteriaceae bacterium]
LRKRGYNQVELFAKAIANKLHISYIDDVLIKVTPTASQVFKARFARLFSSEEIFSVQHLNKISGRHLLLVDDVMTTGATLEACSKQLLKAKDVELSIATIAVTQ